MDPQQTSRYKSSGEALEELNKQFNLWSGKLSDRSFELSIIVIGANWAVFGSDVKDNILAISSILAAVLSIGISLVGTYWLGELLRTQYKYAESDLKRWEEEYEKTKGKDDPWPFTLCIDKLGGSLRKCKAWLPILGGILFFLGVLSAKLQ